MKLNLIRYGRWLRIVFYAMALYLLLTVVVFATGDVASDNITLNFFLFQITMLDTIAYSILLVVGSYLITKLYGMIRNYPIIKIDKNGLYYKNVFTEFKSDLDSLGIVYFDKKLQGERIIFKSGDKKKTIYLSELSKHKREQLIEFAYSFNLNLTSSYLNMETDN